MSHCRGEEDRGEGGDIGQLASGVWIDPLTDGNQ